MELKLHTDNAILSTAAFMAAIPVGVHIALLDSRIDRFATQEKAPLSGAGLSDEG